MTYLNKEKKTMKPKKNLITIFVVTILVTMFGQTDIAKSQVVTDGLLSYWTFDAADIADETAKDAWGKRDGTILGDTYLTAGMAITLNMMIQVCLKETRHERCPFGLSLKAEVSGQLLNGVQTEGREGLVFWLRG